MAARIALVADPDGPGGRLQRLADDGTPAAPPEQAADLAAAVAAAEAREQPRWVWASTDGVYPGLLPQRLARCHDLALVEPLLLGHEDRYGHPRSLGAAWARLHGLPVPEDRPDSGAPDGQPTLFQADRHQLPPGTDPLRAVVEVHADQQRRVARTEHPGRMRLLCAAESAGALAAAEMAYEGLPWRADVHDELLTRLLGPRPPAGGRPRLLAELAAEVQRALGGRPFNPDSHAQVLRAFAEQGISLPSTRSWVLQQVDHPAAALMLRYKEVSRIHAAHGWAWQETWARGGRFRPEYVVGGVVSGRWASRGGGALQIPRMLRGAVVADPGWSLVVADAAQLEPRVLAALSGDAGLARAAAQGDLYQALAATAFGGDRARAKLGLLGAMYGQTSGEVGPLLTVLRRRFPAAMAHLEAAARTGEQGGVVRSRLGRVCPPPSGAWQEATGSPEAGEAGGEAGVAGWVAEPDGDRAARAARARGRFTRNFVIQASAADWALALLAALRRRLAEIGPDATGGRPQLVFFQHDEVVVHVPTQQADAVAAAVAAAGEEARTLVFGATAVRMPLEAHVVECYADAK
ncbi:bifunctional 3'-5' exonuclease/DNA polymerase [Peterkaempfera bronchialis]|uniref:DNA-directed DNA polymerase n=1 Tax=Peterkaempfera bronchialis TaxID=2126346 RepID=A0A345SV69_9ACTN|nr:bifunctional 3'-5' exonuclease/DNA polymerase [Peterkaempfera bronchialis]AXI77624.1 bifunctional 3'-5' exonuclease/DNA polymerase [Peterkaempfera bronchialis]